MKYFKILALIAILPMVVNCGGSKSASVPVPTPVSIGTSEAFGLVANATNVVTVSLGTTCQVGSSAYQNEICVSVTVCNPTTTSNCTTINNVLLDTGSYGLRLFTTSALTALSLPAETDTISGNSLYNCATYLDGSGDWGQVVKANISLGGQTATSLPIEVITSATTPTPSGNCAASTGVKLDSDPAAAGFNGIIGVGLFQQDCGSSCTTPSNTTYYACPSSGACSSAGVSLAKQVSNPVFSFASGYNNGLVMNLPNVAGLGTASASGQMIFGIASVSNNTPVSSTKLTANALGFFKTTYNGSTYTKGFIDSGSNGLYFPGTNVSLCSDGEFYCPSSYVNLTGIMVSNASSTITRSVDFQITNTNNLLNTNGGGNRVFNNFGGFESTSSQYFDWGLPVFLGRKIYIGFDGQSATVNSSTWTGPYWAL